MSAFQPSAASLDSRKRALRTLKYAKKAISSLETFIEKSKAPIPGWVLIKITQSAQALGSAVTYTRYQENRDENL